jgi:hypothetical protein
MPVDELLPHLNLEYTFTGLPVRTPPTHRMEIDGNTCMDGSRIGDYLTELFHLGAESPVAGTGKRLIKHIFEDEDPHKEGS